MTLLEDDFRAAVRAADEEDVGNGWRVQFLVHKDVRVDVNYVEGVGTFYWPNFGDILRVQRKQGFYHKYNRERARRQRRARQQ